MNVFKIVIICIIVAVFCLLVRGQRPEFSLLTATIAVVLILTFILNSLISPLNSLSQRLERYGIELSYFKVALKALGIGYVTSFSADICRDAGQTSLASIAETAGKCGIFLLSMPLVINIVDLALEFIK